MLKFLFKNKKTSRGRASSRNYYSSRPNNYKSRRIFKYKFLFVKKLIIKIIAVFFLTGIFYAIFFSSFFEIKNINISGNHAVDGGEIKEIVNALSSRKKLKFINNNLLFIQDREIQQKIIESFNSVKSVGVIKKFPNEMEIIISEKPADISWCNKITVEKIPIEAKFSVDENMASEFSQCYLSDEDGFIYKKKGESAPNESVNVFRDEKISIGEKISDEKLKNFIRQIIAGFTRKTGLNISYLYVLPASSRELHLVTSVNWKIFFDLNRDADDQINILNAFLKNQIFENNIQNIDYIDLRIIDRVYYKEKK